MTVTLKDDRGQIWEFDNEREARQAIRLGMSQATPEDIKYDQERRLYESPTGKLVAAGAGLLSMGTLGTSDIAAEKIVPGITRNTDEHSPLIRGGTELATLIGGTLATGGALGATRLGAAAIPRAGLAAGQKVTSTTIRHALKTGGLKAAASAAASRAAASPTARMLGEEALMGAAIGQQQGLKQSAIEGADLEKTVSNVFSSIATGAALGAGTGLLLGTTLNQFQKFKGATKTQIAAGFESSGVPAGQASKMADIVGDAIEKELKTAPGAHRTAPLYDYIKSHPNPQDAIKNIVWEAGSSARKKLADELTDTLTQFQQSSKFLDEVTQDYKINITKKLASNPSSGTKPYLELTQFVNSTKEKLENLRKYVREQVVGKAPNDKQVKAYVNRLNEQFNEIFVPVPIIKKVDGVDADGNKIVIDTLIGYRGKTAVQRTAEQISKANHGTERLWRNYTGVSMIANLDRFKRSMFAGESAIVAAGKKGGRGRTVVDASKEIYRNIKDVLEVPDVVGKTFAKFQKELNAGTTDLMGVGGSRAPFANEWLPKIPRGKDVDYQKWVPLQNPAPEKIERIVNAFDDQSAASNVSREVLLRYVDDQAIRARAVIDAANKTQVVIPDHILQGARRTIELRDKLAKIMDPSIKGSAAGDVMAYNYFKDAKRFDVGDRNINQGLVSAAMGAGYALGAPGFMLYQAVRGVGSVGNMAQAPARTFQSLGALYLKSKAKDGVVSRGMERVFSRRVKAPGVVKQRAKGKRRPSFRYGLTYLGADQIQYEKSLEEYRRQFANPEEAQKKIYDALLPLGDQFNDLRAVAIAKDEQIRTYMLQLAPTAALNPYMIGRPRPPSKTEAERYNRVDYILRNPQEAATRLADRRLTVEEVDGLKVIWPKIFESMQIDAMQRIVDLNDKGEILPWADRIQLGTLLEIPTDPLLDYKAIQGFQISYAEEKKRQPRPPQQQSSPSRIARSYQSESEKTELGEYIK